ncbi:SAV_915 family protein, partial [Streptomyces mirabilis]|uniref:SAV_915 family protein n=1 Tax=Streptomyces mirabilis TaxID=68239 RepID=UPI0036A4308D
MSPVDRSEDPEPSERFPAGLLFVPVRSGPAGCTARFFRTPLGSRTAVGFTSAARLTATLGTDQACIRLCEPALRALAAPLGVTTLTIDPQLSAPLGRPHRGHGPRTRELLAPLASPARRRPAGD